MLSQNVQALLQKLQALDSRALFLVGGSAERGDASAESDIDIYCIAPVWKLFFLKEKIQKFQTTVSDQVHCMLVPQTFFKWGWYYIEGVSAAGLRFKTIENPIVIVRNCLILALQHALVFRANDNTQSFMKALQQLSALIRFKAKNYESLSFAKADLIPFATGINKDNLIPTIEQLLVSERSKLSFSWSAFWIYNMHFIKQGQLLNLRLNPVILVLHKLDQELHTPTHNGLKKIQKVLFPVYILTNNKSSL